MSYSTLPISFWGYALNTAIHLLNLVLLGSKDLGTNVFRTLMCIVGKP